MKLSRYIPWLAAAVLLFGRKSVSSFRPPLVDISRTHASDKRNRQGKSKKHIIMVHQTDGNGSNNPSAWGWVKAHLGVMPNGHLVLIHPLSSDVAGSYSDTIAIEIAGKFPAFLHPDPSDRAALRFNKTHTWRVSPAQKAGIEGAIEFAIQDILRDDPTERMDNIWLLAHEQLQQDRLYDPGEEPYRVAARYAKRRGLQVPYHYYKDSGRPIHAAWRV